MDKTKKFILINAGLLLLEVIWATWQYNKESQYDGHMAGLVWLFLPVTHTALSLLLTLVFFMLGNKEMAQKFALLLLGILLIGFSLCFIISL